MLLYTSNVSQSEFLHYKGQTTRKKKGGSSFSAVATEISRKLFYFVGLYWVADMHVHNYFMIYLRSSVMLFKIKVRVYFQIILFIYLITINVIIKPICSWFSCFAIWLQESNWTSMLVSAFCDPGLRCRHRRKFWFQNLRKPASLPICKRRRQKRRGETLGQPRLPLCAEVKFFPNRGRNCWERETRLFSSCHQCDEHWPRTPIPRNGSRGANHTPTLPHRECCLSLPLSHTCWLCHAAHACKQVCRIYGCGKKSYSALERRPQNMSNYCSNSDAVWIENHIVKMPPLIEAERTKCTKWATKLGPV